MRPHPRVETAPQVASQPGVGHASDPRKRYSWVETPMELQGAGYLESAHKQSIPPLPPLPSEHTNTGPLTENTFAQSSCPDDKKFDALAGSMYSQPSLEETHPAHSVPYADITSFQQASLPPQPQSPGPVPMKSDLYVRDTTQRSVPTPVEPDSSSLRSPTGLAAKGRSFTPSYQPDAPTGPDGLAPENHLPGQVPHPNQSIQGGTWKYGLCDCGDIGTCCTGIFCPCIVYGKTQYRLSQRSARRDPTNMLGYETFNGSCAVMAVLCGCGCMYLLPLSPSVHQNVLTSLSPGILAAIQHTRTRKMYEIEGGVGSDCVRALCCTCCTLIQDEKEIKNREGHARRFAGPTVAANAPYMSPDRMTYAPPPR